MGLEVWKPSLDLSRSGIKVLGTPIGTCEFISTVGLSIISKGEQLLQHIPKLSSLQISWLLLYFCAVPRINHPLRTIPPNLVIPIATEHDDRIFRTFRQLFNIPSTTDWTSISCGFDLLPASSKRDYLYASLVQDYVILVVLLLLHIGLVGQIR